MGYVVKMPKLGLEMEQGTLLEWHVAEGDSVEEGETIVEVESEKSIGEVDAREDGVLRLIGLEEGEAVPPGTPIGIVASPDEDIADMEAEFDTEATTTDSEADEEATATASADSENGETSETRSRSPSEASDVKASPRAERRAEELGVDLSEVTGTGPQGAVTADDVESAAETESEADPTSEQIRASPRAERRAEELEVDIATVNGSGPQGAITVDDVEAAVERSPDHAESEDQESNDAELGRTKATPDVNYRTKTYVSHGDEANTVIETAERASKAFDFDVSTTDVLLLAISATLKDRPEFNATLEDDTYHIHDRQTIAVASDTDADGEPGASVIPDVGERTLADIVEATSGQNTSVDDESERRPTFLLADGESRETERITPSPPTVAGLFADCSRRRATPAENGNGVELDRYLQLRLRYDARAVGDREAEAFLESLLKQMERVPELVLRTYR